MMRGSRPSRILTATRTGLCGPARLRAGDAALVLQAYGATTGGAVGLLLQYALVRRAGGGSY